MHVKQLTTSQAFQIIPRKAIVDQDMKALQVLSDNEPRTGEEKRQPGLFEVT